jgi:hypothetical protein
MQKQRGKRVDLVSNLLEGILRQVAEVIGLEVLGNIESLLELHETGSSLHLFADSTVVWYPRHNNELLVTEVVWEVDNCEASTISWELIAYSLVLISVLGISASQTTVGINNDLLDTRGVLSDLEESSIVLSVAFLDIRLEEVLSLRGRHNSGSHFELGVFCDPIINISTKKRKKKKRRRRKYIGRREGENQGKKGLESLQERGEWTSFYLHIYNMKIYIHKYSHHKHSVHYRVIVLKVERVKLCVVFAANKTSVRVPCFACLRH